MADIIQDNLPATNSMPRDEIVTLAKKIRKPMWHWHIYIGYVLTGLFCIRLTLPVFGKMKFVSPFNKQITAKVKFQYWVYLVFYACLTISLVSGLIIELGPKDLKKSMEEIHVLSVYYLIPFLILHLGGVLIAEFSTQPGIISEIISGNKQKY